MTSEILMHINENMSTEEQRDFLLSYGNKPGGLEAHLHSQKRHFMFVAYDPQELCPHDLVAIAMESGVHAQVIDL